MTNTTGLAEESSMSYSNGIAGENVKYSSAGGLKNGTGVQKMPVMMDLTSDLNFEAPKVSTCLYSTFSNTN